PICNAVGIFRLKGADDPDIRWAQDVIDRQVQQLTRLVDDLLDVSRITCGKIELRKETLPISAVVERAVETAPPVIDASRHQLRVSLPNDPVFLTVDPTRLAQVLANLLNNAARYTRPGGSIALTVECAGGWVVMKVADNGVGIPREMLVRVFDLFT